MSLCIAAAVCCFRPRSWRTLVLYMDPYPMRGGGGLPVRTPQAMGPPQAPDCCRLLMLCGGT